MTKLGQSHTQELTCFFQYRLTVHVDWVNLAGRISANDYETKCSIDLGPRCIKLYVISNFGININYTTLANKNRRFTGSQAIDWRAIVLMLVICNMSLGRALFRVDYVIMGIFEWYDLTWHDMTWYNMIWYNMIWYNMI